MKLEWYISFHGGAESGALNNIHVHSPEGRKLRKALNQDSLPPTVALRELRGFTMGPDGMLYVVNAFREFSQVLRFKGKRNKHKQHSFHDIFVQPDAARNSGLIHPFSVTFDVRGNLHVTSQDTSLTLRYFGPGSDEGVPGTAMPLPPALRNMAGGSFHPGTFCASATQVPHGLVVVRGAVFFAGLLYVADRDADCVKKFDALTAAYCGEIAAPGLIDKPIHLVVEDGTLYIGNRGNESVAKCNLQTEMVTAFVEPKSGGLKNPSGLAFGRDGFFYVGSRGSRQILRFRSADGRPDLRPFIDDLEDEPEFIQLVD